MSTIFETAAREALLARMDRVTPQSQRRWGQMTAPQMVWHLDAQLQDILGERKAKPAREGIFRSPIFHWLILDTPLPWPRGNVPSAPEYLAFAPGEWATDVAQLKARLVRYAEPGQANAARVHPAFGPLDGRQMGRLLWRHWNHHLTQFGA